MGEALLRFALVGGIRAVAGLIGLWSRRRPFHPPVDITGAGFDSGLVVFTSTECRRCREVLAAAKSTGTPLREVTYELEPGLQERLGVTGVPLTLVVDGSGQVAAQFAGKVGSRKLRRAVTRAGV